MGHAGLPPALAARSPRPLPSRARSFAPAPSPRHCAPPTDNAEFYARNGVPFVMGTTGGDRARVAAAAEAAGVYAVVAPQMGKQVGGCGAARRGVPPFGGV
jgi:hypothetical protein